jgi:hypothetical protein
VTPDPGARILNPAFRNPASKGSYSADLSVLCLEDRFVVVCHMDLPRGISPLVEQRMERRLAARKGGPRVRITGQFIDAVSGAHLWADHSDGSVEDVFELQDKVAVSVAGVIGPALVNAAYALAYFGEDIEAAMGLIDRALALNPGSARGWFESGWLGCGQGSPNWP